ncbi:MAG: hypothetical protein QOE70_750 [Chthoniobacter sp.]|jgi:hypothetical protein|nr:hypothetical protein [Chthoniobacter sp.]
MKSLRLLYPRFIAALAASVLACSLIATGLAEEPGKAAAATPEQEAKFIATLTNATLKGRWCGVKDGQLGPEKEDAYTIVSVTKLGGENWQINARLTYGGKDIDLPIPAQVKWAGDTPVLILDKVSMGTSRTYSARVMIYDQTYAGWWTAPDHGGLLNGVITNGKN